MEDGTWKNNKHNKTPTNITTPKGVATSVAKADLCSGCGGQNYPTNYWLTLTWHLNFKHFLWVISGFFSTLEMYVPVASVDIKCRPNVVLRTLQPASPCCSSWPSLPLCFTDSILHSDSDKSRKAPEQPTHYEQRIILKKSGKKKAMQQSFFCGACNSLILQPPIFSATTLWLSVLDVKHSQDWSRPANLS